MPDGGIPRPSRWRARLIVAGAATALALLAAELATRVLLGDQAILFPRYTTGANYGPYHLRRLRPSTTFRHTSADGSWLFTTNAQGFRDQRNWQYERKPGAGRILVLGDSHTQGFECRQEDTYCAVLERRLGALGQPTEVLNTGISGFGTAEQLAFLENEGVKYRPDTVVLGWFINDPDDNVNAGLFAMRDGQLTEEKFVHQPGVKALDAINRWAPLRWLSEHSYFYSLLFNRIWNWQKGVLFRGAHAAAATELTVAAPSSDAAMAEYRHTLAAKLIERMSATCQRQGIRFIVAEIPYYKTPTDFVPSLPGEMIPDVRNHCDALLLCDEWLGPYRGVTELFRVHGQQHISETTHLILGMTLAEKIAAPR